MLLRGQNLIGYRHYADDIVREFVRLSAQNGVDIFRIFDALNDIRNLEVSIEEVKNKENTRKERFATQLRLCILLKVL